MDHVSGFDSMFRFNFGRSETPLMLIGPQDSIRVISNRIRGYTWNLVSESSGALDVREVSNEQLRDVRLSTRSGFEDTQWDRITKFSNPVFDTPDVQFLDLNQGCRCAGYVVREKERTNVDVEKLKQLGFASGPWISQLKDASLNDGKLVTIGDATKSLGELRELLLVNSAGNSLAYLTDFRPTEAEREILADSISGVDTLVCENNYRDADVELAEQHFHLTSSEVGRLAADASAGRLILFHVSDRYSTEELEQQLVEVRHEFENSFWPENWFESSGVE